jgi:hypothetical protein
VRLEEFFFLEEKKNKKYGRKKKRKQKKKRKKTTKEMESFFERGNMPQGKLKPFSIEKPNFRFCFRRLVDMLGFQFTDRKVPRLLSII